MRKFGLIGAAGYIAPRHMEAIKKNNCELLAALDPNDSVGIIDSYFPKAHFFTEFERFDRHLHKLKLSGTTLDYISITSPNYLHDSHIRYALRAGSNVICEKPIVLNPHNIDGIKEIERESGKKVYNILQLRHHPNILKLRDSIHQKLQKQPDYIFNIDLTYITPRGLWYHSSWKGDISKSGGISTNIGVHFFDMLSWIFGEHTALEIHHKDHNTNAGYLEFKNAKIRWFLSIDSGFLQSMTRNVSDIKTFRSITIDESELEFSDGFVDLHTKSYESILNNQGFGLTDSLESIKITSLIRSLDPKENSNNLHPLLAEN